MTEIHDYVVVGSGCTGAMAAQTLVDAGARTTMLDVGHIDHRYAEMIPDKDFVTIRQSERDQYRYFIGEEWEGLPGGAEQVAPQLTPPRKFVVAKANKYIPFESSTFRATESLAYGGLGNAWGTGCCVFSDAELARAGLDPGRMFEAYRTVSARIGVSGMWDDAAPYTLGSLDNFLPGMEIDANSRRLYAEYVKKRAALNRRGFYMGQPALAVITRELDGRKRLAYREMDFYSDRDQSAYRPWITIDRLKQRGNFRYIGNVLVLRFSESDGVVTVECLNTLDDRPTAFRCRRLVLAAGVLGTARIVLRSMSGAGQRLPLLTNQHAFFPCVHVRMLGKGIETRKSSFAQLSLFHDEGGEGTNVAMAVLFSYRALMMFRLIQQVPLNMIDSRIILNYLMSGLVIMGVHHPEAAGDAKYLHLEADEGSITGDRLRANYVSTEAERAAVTARERKFLRAMRSLGCYPMGRVDPGPGSGIHYAGTLPYGAEGAPFTLRPDGKLNGAHGVFVADGSGFRYLPAKGLTFSLMANAHRVATNVLEAGLADCLRGETSQ